MSTTRPDPIRFMQIRQIQDSDYEKAQNRMAEICLRAELLGRSAVASVLHEALLGNGVSDQPMPPHTTPETELARMLLLADYAQRDVAVNVLDALELGSYARQLESRPVIQHRDDLPPAQEALTELIDRIRSQGFSESYDDASRARYSLGEYLLRSLRGGFSELDGYVPKIHCVMAWLVRSYGMGRPFVDKDAIWQKVCAI